MKREACVYEQAVTRAVASNQLNESMQAHLAACDVCQETVRVAGWMQKLAQTNEDERALPSAGFVRWKSQLFEKREIARRATRPITIIQVASGIIVLLALALLFLWQPSAIGHALSRLRWSNFHSSLGEFYILLAVALLCFTAIYLAIAYALNFALKINFD